MASKRPTGVSIICILGFIGAILQIIGGITMAAFSDMVASAIAWDPSSMMALGVITLIIGIITFIGVYWLWKMLKKGWTIVMVLEILGLIIGIATMNIISIVIALIILIYLWMKRALFK